MGYDVKHIVGSATDYNEGSASSAKPLMANPITVLPSDRNHNTPSVVGDEGSVELLLDTDLTPPRLLNSKASSWNSSNYATIVEQYILQGEVLHTIQQKAFPEP